MAGALSGLQAEHAIWIGQHAADMMGERRWLALDVYYIISIYMANEIHKSRNTITAVTAGPHHALFSLSLTDVYRAPFGFGADMARVEGLPVRQTCLSFHLERKFFLFSLPTWLNIPVNLLLF